MKHLSFFVRWLVMTTMIMLPCCVKNKAYNEKPELESLRQGLKTSVAIGYCASIATAFKGMTLPDNVIFDKSKSLIYIKIDREHPLPFNSNIGDIILACLWGNEGGVMSILFGNFDLLGGGIKLYGLYMVPLIQRTGENEIHALFAKQDIILGNGSDTILDLSNITAPVFNADMDRLNSDNPTDAFAVVKQNVWFINIDQKGTYSDPYDDDITINGGGQIAEVKGASGGIIYHALIDTKTNYSVCTQNPVSGYGLTQNFKAGGEPYIDLGNSLLRFHGTCDGLVHVELSTGKYFSYINKNIALELQ
jgi:hypothetical protein